VNFSAQHEQPFAGKENSQVYLMGSLYEGFPNAVIEANAVGIPVVAKDVPGGISDIIIDADNGFLTVSDDDFRKKILIATTYPFNRKHISESAIQRFEIKKMTTSIVTLFSKLYSLKKK
jgi:glycosyltransferase involved in cell wall biosynthesis